MVDEYEEPKKLLSRQQVIESAISALTTDRVHATLCRRTYVREVRDALVDRKGYDAAVARQLTDESIDPAPNMPSFMSRVRSPYAPGWGELQRLMG